MNVPAAPADPRLRTAAFIVEDLPLAHQSGYRTYNRAFVEALLASGWQVHLIVTGPRLRAPIFDADRDLALPGAAIHCLATIRFAGRHWVWKPPALLRALRGWLPASLRSAMSRSRRTRKGRAVARIGRFSTTREVRVVEKLLGRLQPDVVLVDTILRAACVARTARPAARVLVAHDVFHQRCESLARAGIESRPWISEADERRWLGGFDRIVAISESDARQLAALVPAVPVDTIAPAIDVAHGASEGNVPTDQRVLYVGSAAHHNVDGLGWFLDHCWAGVRQACPEAKLDIVGDAGLALPGPLPAGVQIHGRIENLDDVASHARFAIDPVRAGSGLKVKLLDYFAQGLACITTTEGAAGFPPQADRPIVTRDDLEGFTREVISWLRSPPSKLPDRASVRRYVTQFSATSFQAHLERTLAAAATCGPGEIEPAHRSKR